MWWLFLSACSPSGTDVRAAFDAEIANVLHVEVTAPDATRARVRWGEGTQLDRHTPWSESAVSHEFWVTDLPEDTSIQWAVETSEGLTPTEQVQVPSTGIPQATVTAHVPESSQMTHGRVVVALTDSSGAGLVILDGLGRARWGLLYPQDRTAAHPSLAQNGTDLLALSPRRDRLVDDIDLWRIPLDGSTARRRTRLPRAHHMYAQLPEGDFAWLGLDAQVLDISDLGQAESEWSVMADTLWRGPEQFDGVSSGEVFWSYLDDWPHDFYLPCEHLQMEESRFEWTDVHEWTHSNSLVHLPETGELWMGTRLHDSVLVFDADTGTLLRELGGAHSEYDIDDPWSHGHFSDVWPGGLLMFDNGNHRQPQSTRVVAYAIDEAERTMHATTVWELDAFSAYLGDAKRLPGGNILVATGQTSELLELTPTGEVVWRAVFPGQMAVGRIAFLDSLAPPVVGVVAP